jgi:hypothetical protein
MQMDLPHVGYLSRGIAHDVFVLSRGTQDRSRPCGQSGILMRQPVKD